ncbi:twin-arginine translocase subunit TatB [Thiorhodococcus mannitoliphagus]|uniref:Sec-independent protein translocase protein TatB n=1 Tax=Thiorhodococcus mannitoliphagus TaxID=329406 RepID=A0A6P1DWP0_9GAMM|nr:Sec-independent protein translocase protein TatB [Thiorhodococcus mannitoliphagus]NEX21411.1 twin-arginine translocase subunit TatB [Thiorhodococcus mannitoliphagus]
MFDVGFQELLLIGVVALIVVGPERLPKLARTAGMWVGRARRTLSSVKQEIDRELKAEELKQVLERQSLANPLDTILEETPQKVGQSSTQATETQGKPAVQSPSAGADPRRTP